MGKDQLVNIFPVLRNGINKKIMENMDYGRKDEGDEAINNWDSLL